MPGTQFDDTIYFKKNVLTVSGPLEPEEDEDARQLLIVAFVTQRQPGNPGEAAKDISVAGEARLFPTAKNDTWQLVRPKSEINPAPSTGPSKGLSYKYSLVHSTNWRFRTPLNDLKKGPAFATGLLIAYEDDGTTETYGWSRWLEIDERP